MKTKVYLAIAIRIIFLGAAGMAVSFIPEHLRVFFGDVEIKPTSNPYQQFEPYWDWGVRHCWFFWTMILLLILSVVNISMSIRNIIIKNYDISG